MSGCQEETGFFAGGSLDNEGAVDGQEFEKTEAQERFGHDGFLKKGGL